MNDQYVKDKSILHIPSHFNRKNRKLEKKNDSIRTMIAYRFLKFREAELNDNEDCYY